MERDGGPAFPHISESVSPNLSKKITGGGMSLRAYFAGQALTGMIGSRYWMENASSVGAPIEDVIAEWSVEQSDALIAALAKAPE